MPPGWLEVIAWIALVTAVICSSVIVIDIVARNYRQRMA